ncbi:hypothetical protein [Blautia sp. 1033sp1_1033st1_G9_1033SCRN_220408]|uniref:hypothetical protein n=1 Tax=Blautia sp. 1033sp1_1033st1_G9_1033SCRN_220408 TaxID=3144490 RepID=UPI0034A1A367
MVETNDSKKKKVKVYYTDHTGQDVIPHFPSHEAAFIGIKKDLENYKKNFFPMTILLSRSLTREQESGVPKEKLFVYGNMPE